MTAFDATARLFTALEAQDLAGVEQALRERPRMTMLNGRREPLLHVAIRACGATPEQRALGQAIVGRVAQAAPDRLRFRMDNGQRPIDVAMDARQWDVVRWMLREGVPLAGHLNGLPALRHAVLDEALDVLVPLVRSWYDRDVSHRFQAVMVIAQAMTTATPSPETLPRWAPVWQACDDLGFPPEGPAGGAGADRARDLSGVSSLVAYLAQLPHDPTAAHGPFPLTTVLLHGADVQRGGTALKPLSLPAFSPLHVAAMAGRVPAVGVLLDFGADPLARAGALDETPLDVARRYAQPEVVAVLERRMLHASLTGQGAAPRPPRPRL